MLLAISFEENRQYVGYLGFYMPTWASMLVGLVTGEFLQNLPVCWSVRFVTGEFLQNLPVCWSVRVVCLSVCVSVCLWTSLGRYNSVSFLHINMPSTYKHSHAPNCRLSVFHMSRSKVKVIGVKSCVFGSSTITQKDFVRFSQNLVFRSRKSRP